MGTNASNRRIRGTVRRDRCRVEKSRRAGDARVGYLGLNLRPAGLRSLRRRLGLPIKAASALVGVRPATWQAWEAGQRQPSRRSLRLLETASLLAERRAPKPSLALLHPIRIQPSQAILSRIRGKRIVASISGGKDSAAMSLFLHECGIEHERVFADTGWEADLTYEYIRTVLTETLGPITWVRAARQMEDLIRHKLMFPGRTARYCTEMLKTAPIADHIGSAAYEGLEVVNAVGIRAAESPARADMTEWDWSKALDCEVWRPLINWSEQDVIDIHRRHGLSPNPLYLKGAKRVGCWPCIFSRKSEVRLIAESDPARLVRLRVLEQEVGDLVEARATSRGKTLSNRPSWFQNPTTQRRPDGSRDGSCWPIDRVVAWSRSEPRGKVSLDRDEFLLAGNQDGCARWGYCEGSAA